MPDQHPDFEPGDEPIDVERRPGGSGLVVRIDFDSVEAFKVMSRAEFEDLSLVEYCKRTILEHASQYTWSKFYSLTQTQ